MKRLDHGDTKVLAVAEGAATAMDCSPCWCGPRRRWCAAGARVCWSPRTACPSSPTTFLPPFNEGTLLIGMRLNPGVTLAEARRSRARAEVLVKQVPEVTTSAGAAAAPNSTSMPRACTSSELDVGLKPTGRTRASMDAIGADIRARLVNLPASIGVGQPISHRIDHMLSGVRSQIAIKIFGETSTCCAARPMHLRAKLAAIPGLADLEIEKQVLAPQIKVRIDYAPRLLRVPAPQVLTTLQRPGRRRCEINWPTPMEASRFASRARISAPMASMGAYSAISEADVEFAHALGMLVELGAAASPPDVRHLGHLLDQHLGLARERRALGQRRQGSSRMPISSVPSLTWRGEGAAPCTSDRHRRRPRCCWAYAGGATVSVAVAAGLRALHLRRQASERVTAPRGQRRRDEGVPGGARRPPAAAKFPAITVALHRCPWRPARPRRRRVLGVDHLVDPETDGDVAARVMC